MSFWQKKNKDCTMRSMFSEKNLPRLIIATPILAIIVLTVVLLLFLIKVQKDYLIQETLELEKEYMARQKGILEKEVNGIFTYIDYQRNLLIKNSKKNIKIEMQGFINNLPASKTAYYDYIAQNTNSITDFVIFDVTKNSVIKHSDLFFYFEKLNDFEKILKGKRNTFWMEDETNLYYFIHDSKRKLIYVVIKDIYYQLSDLKDSIAKWVEFARYDDNNYFWIHTNTNRLIAHPYRQRDIGKDDTLKKDEAGNLFIQHFVRQAIKNREGSFVKFKYPKPNETTSTEKLSFVKLYDEWHWIIGSGIYLDEIQKVLVDKQKNVEQKIDRYIQTVVVIAFIVIIFISLLSLLISQQTNTIFSSYKEKVLKKELSLKELNRTLASRIQEALKEAKKKDRALLHQSRLAQMGEMISMIAHQWRQPLSEISGILMEMKFAANFEKVDKAYIEKEVEDGDRLIDYMSKTIDDFRDFFKPAKAKEAFSVVKACKDAIILAEATLKHKHIQLSLHVKDSPTIKGYPSEYAQVVLNLLLNAKDVLAERMVKEPCIKIMITSIENTSIVTVKDNGQGIDEEIIERIFEPYFSTKKGSGTGLGLYMSKMIIEENMGGKLSVSNDEDGAVFTIKVKNET